MKPNSKSTSEKASRTQGTKLTTGVYRLAAHESEEGGAYKRQKDSISNTITALANSLSALISLGTLIGLVLTIKIARNQWSEMVEATQQATRSADESHAQVEEAKIAIKLSADQFIKDQRPYLWLDDDSTAVTLRVDAPGSGTNSGKLASDFYVKNFGKSPAIGVHSVAFISTGVQDPENDVRWDDYKEDFNNGPGGIYPSGDRFFKTGRSNSPFVGGLPKSFVANPQAPPLGALHARIVYHDQNGKEYVSEICELFRPNEVISRCKTHNSLR